MNHIVRIPKMVWRSYNRLIDAWVDWNMYGSHKPVPKFGNAEDLGQ